jgi:hypothetical protein
MWSRWARISMRWWSRTCMPSRACAIAARPPLTCPAASAARAFGSSSPSAMASRMTRAVLVLASECTTGDSLTRAPSRSFSSRCHCRVRSRTTCSRARVRSRSARISGGGTNEGRSRPISASRAIHWASSWSVFGRPASCRAWRELTSCTRRPASSGR